MPFGLSMTRESLEGGLGGTWLPVWTRWVPIAGKPYILSEGSLSTGVSDRIEPRKPEEKEAAAPAEPASQAEKVTAHEPTDVAHSGGSGMQVQQAKAPECVVCMDAPAETVFVPRGHLAACAQCAGRLAKRPCPMCRKKIKLVQRIFPV